MRFFDVKKICYLISILLVSECLSFQEVQSVKIENDTGAELGCSHTIPSDSTAYLHVVSNKIPYAYITSWSPGSHGTAKGCRELDARKPLPTWIRIAFSQEVRQLFVDDFFSILKSTNSVFKNINPIRIRQCRGQFGITIPAHYTKQELEVFRDQVHIAMQKRHLLKNAEPVRSYAISEEVVFKPSVNTDTLKLEISNGSSITVSANIPLVHSGDFHQTILVFPNETCGGWNSLKNKHIFITTAKGTFQLGPDDMKRPTEYYLIQYVKDGNRNSHIIQKLPFKFLEKISIQISPDGAVSMIDHSKEGYYV